MSCVGCEIECKCTSEKCGDNCTCAASNATDCGCKDPSMCKQPSGDATGAGSCCKVDEEVTSTTTTITKGCKCIKKQEESKEAKAN